MLVWVVQRQYWRSTSHLPARQGDADLSTNRRHVWSQRSTHRENVTASKTTQMFNCYIVRIYHRFKWNWYYLSKPTGDKLHSSRLHQNKYKTFLNKKSEKRLAIRQFSITSNKRHQRHFVNIFWKKKIGWPNLAVFWCFNLVNESRVRFLIVFKARNRTYFSNYIRKYLRL